MDEDPTRRLYADAMQEEREREDEVRMARCRRGDHEVPPDGAQCVWCGRVPGPMIGGPHEVADQYHSEPPRDPRQGD
jgi:hypothetical protein